MKQSVGLALVLIAAIGAIGISVYHYLGSDAQRPTPPPATSRPLSPEPPDVAPDFALTDLDGDVHRLSTWTADRGHYVLLNFWAPWCGPCRDEVPMLIDLQKRYGDDGLRVLGPAVDRREAVVRFARDTGINYPVFPGQEKIIDLSAAYGDTMGALPYSVLIAPDGRILHAHAGELSQARAERWMETAFGGGS